MAAARRPGRKGLAAGEPGAAGTHQRLIPASVAAEQAAFQTHQSFRHSRLASIP